MEIVDIIGEKSRISGMDRGLPERAFAEWLIAMRGDTPRSEFSEKTGIQLSTIYLLEKGEQDLSLRQVKKILAATGTSPAEMWRLLAEITRRLELEDQVRGTAAPAATSPTPPAGRRRKPAA